MKGAGYGAREVCFAAHCCQVCEKINLGILAPGSLGVPPTGTRTLFSSATDAASTVDPDVAIGHLLGSGLGGAAGTLTHVVGGYSL
jgi:hypothetical protein